MILSTKWFLLPAMGGCSGDGMGERGETIELSIDFVNAFDAAFITRYISTTGGAKR